MVSRLRKRDWAVAVGAIVYLVCLIIPWFSFGDGGGLDVSTNGFSDKVLGSFGLGYPAGLAVFAWILLLVAAAVVLLPAFPKLHVPIPGRLVAAALAVLAFVLTLVVWIRTLTINWDDVGSGADASHFSVMALITLLVSAAIAALAVVDALPDLKDLQAGRASGAAAQRSAGQGHPGQQFPDRQFPVQGFPGQGYPPQQQWEQQSAQPQQYAPPPPSGQSGQYTTPPVPPVGERGRAEETGRERTGGSTASGEGEGPRSGS